MEFLQLPVKVYNRESLRVVQHVAPRSTKRSPEHHLVGSYLDLLEKNEPLRSHFPHV